MACNNCNLSKCGCQDSYLTTPPPCPVPSDCAEAQPCSEVFPAECVLYTGAPITCGDVDVVGADTPVSDAMASIVSFFCDQLAINEDILCGLDVVVPANTSLEDTLPLIVTYFCDVIANLPIDEPQATFNSASVSFVDTVEDPSGCVTRTYTITYYKGIAPGPYFPVDTVIFSTPPVCPQADPCSAQSFPTPNPLPGIVDSVLMCRASELGTFPIQIPWTDVVANIPTGGGGLTWVTQTCAGACLSLTTLPNHGYINVNTNPGPQGSPFILPLGANVGDVVKIICRSGLGNVTCDATQVISFGGGAGINSPGIPPGVGPTDFTTPIKFYIGQSEVIQFLYVGDNNWVIDTFVTSQDQSNASGWPITFRIQ